MKKEIRKDNGRKERKTKKENREKGKRDKETETGSGDR